MIRTMSMFMGAMLLSFSAGALEPIKIGVDPNLKPFAYISETGEISGFDIDIAKAVCEDVGKTCTFVPIEWDGLILSLRTKRIDAIVSAMSITKERSEVVDFSRPYYRSVSQLMRHRGTIDGGKNIGVLIGSTDESYALVKYPGYKVISYTNQYEMLFDLEAGRLRYALGPRLELLAGTNKPEEFEFVGELIDDKEYYGPGIGIAINKNNGGLLTLLDSSINNIRESGRWQEISDKYFDEDIWVY